MKSNSPKEPKANLISASEYLQYIRDSKIPPNPPDGSLRPEDTMLGMRLDRMDQIIALYTLKEECALRGMHSIVDQVWTGQLANWLGRRRCLEVMSGAGWTAKALAQHGALIIATDSWGEAPVADKRYHVLPVLKLDAESAVQSLGSQFDVLLLSWPRATSALDRCCELWGPHKPIVFIGELTDATSTDLFRDRFQARSDQPEFKLHRTPWLKDFVFIGNYII